jgi:hypothetical protein
VRRTAWSIAGAPFLLPRKDSFYGQLRPGPPGFRSGCPPILALVREWCFNEGALRSRYEQVINRGGEWADAQDPAAFRGVAVAGWRSYGAVDGPLQSALLSLYIFLAVLPALLVIDEYLTNNPRALADHIKHVTPPCSWGSTGSCFFSSSR